MYLLPFSVSRKDQHPREAHGENCTHTCEKDVIKKEGKKKTAGFFRRLLFGPRGTARREERVHTFYCASVYTARATVYAESTVSSQ